MYLIYKSFPTLEGFVEETIYDTYSPSRAIGSPSPAPTISLAPTVSFVPTPRPSPRPTPTPSFSRPPSPLPTFAPTLAPSWSHRPTPAPSARPTLRPTFSVAPTYGEPPTLNPTVSKMPTRSPGDDDDSGGGIVIHINVQDFSSQSFLEQAGVPIAFLQVQWTLITQIVRERSTR